MPFFSLPKGWKFSGAMSELYRGWSNTVHPILANAFLIHTMVQLNAVQLNTEQMCRMVLQCDHVYLCTDRGSCWHDVQRDKTSMSQKTVAMTLPPEDAALNFFFSGEFA
jgi:hypothetical protein